MSIELPTLKGKSHEILNPFSFLMNFTWAPVIPGQKMNISVVLGHQLILKLAKTPIFSLYLKIFPVFCPIGRSLAKTIALMSQRSLRATVIHSKRISGLCQYRLGTVLDIVEFFLYRFFRLRESA